MLTLLPSSTFSLQVLSLKFDCETTMALLRFSRLILVLLAVIPQLSVGCPSGCRCYSLTVECGSLGLKEIPQGVLSVTEVSWPIDIKLGRWLPERCCRPHPSCFSGFVSIDSLSDPFLLP